MINHNNERFYDIYELCTLLNEKNVRVFYRSINQYIRFDGLVKVVKAEYSQFLQIENEIFKHISFDAGLPYVLSTVELNSLSSTYNFNGFFQYAYSTERPLCIFPTEYCTIDGNNPDPTNEFYFPLNLMDIMDALDRKNMDETAFTHPSLYAYTLKQNLLNCDAAHVLNLYFLESEVRNYADEKGIELSFNKLPTRQLNADSSGNESDTQASQSDEDIGIESGEGLKDKNCFLETVIGVIEKTRTNPNYQIFEATFLHMQSENYPCSGSLPFAKFYSFLRHQNIDGIVSHSLNSVTLNYYLKSIDDFKETTIEKENLRTAYDRLMVKVRKVLRG